MLPLVTACQSIPNVRFYKEIPFIDAPEGVYFDSLTHDKGFIKNPEWVKMRPLMVMLDPDGVEAIKKQWYEACRSMQLPLAIFQKCNANVDTFMDTLTGLDNIAKTILQPLN